MGQGITNKSLWNTSIQKMTIYSQVRPLLLKNFFIGNNRPKPVVNGSARDTKLVLKGAVIWKSYKNQSFMLLIYAFLDFLAIF